MHFKEKISYNDVLKNKSTLELSDNKNAQRTLLKYTSKGTLLKHFAYFHGHHVLLQMKDGEKVSGQFISTNPDYNVMIISKSKKEICEYDISNIEFISALNIDLSMAFREESKFKIDSEISGPKKPVEKNLTLWNDDDNINGVPDDALDDYLLIPDKTKRDSKVGWEVKDMFETNEREFGLTSTYSERLSEYTTELEILDTPEFKDMEAKAGRLAAEIEGNKAYQYSIALENDDEERELEKNATDPIISSKMNNDKSFFYPSSDRYASKNAGSNTYKTYRGSGSIGYNDRKYKSRPMKVMSSGTPPSSISSTIYNHNNFQSGENSGTVNNHYGRNLRHSITVVSTTNFRKPYDYVMAQAGKHFKPPYKFSPTEDNRKRPTTVYNVDLKSPRSSPLTASATKIMVTVPLQMNPMAYTTNANFVDMPIMVQHGTPTTYASNALSSDNMGLLTTPQSINNANGPNMAAVTTIIVTTNADVLVPSKNVIKEQAQNILKSSKLNPNAPIFVPPSSIKITRENPIVTTTMTIEEKQGVAKNFNVPLTVSIVTTLNNDLITINGTNNNVLTTHSHNNVQKNVIQTPPAPISMYVPSNYYPNNNVVLTELNGPPGGFMQSSNSGMSNYHPYSISSAPAMMNNVFPPTLQISNANTNNTTNKTMYSNNNNVGINTPNPITPMMNGMYCHPQILFHTPQPLAGHATNLSAANANLIQLVNPKTGSPQYYILVQNPQAACFGGTAGAFTQANIANICAQPIMNYNDSTTTPAINTNYAQPNNNIMASNPIIPYNSVVRKTPPPPSVSYIMASSDTNALSNANNNNVYRNVVIVTSALNATTSGFESISGSLLPSEPVFLDSSNNTTIISAKSILSMAPNSNPIYLYNPSNSNNTSQNGNINSTIINNPQYYPETILSASGNEVMGTAGTVYQPYIQQQQQPIITGPSFSSLPNTLAQNDGINNNPAMISMMPSNQFTLNNSNIHTMDANNSTNMGLAQRMIYAPPSLPILNAAAAGGGGFANAGMMPSLIAFQGGNNSSQPAAPMLLPYAFIQNQMGMNGIPQTNFVTNLNHTHQNIMPMVSSYNINPNLKSGMLPHYSSNITPMIPLVSTAFNTNNIVYHTPNSVLENGTYMISNANPNPAKNMVENIGNQSTSTTTATLMNPIMVYGNNSTNNNIAQSYIEVSSNNSSGNGPKSMSNLVGPLPPPPPLPFLSGTLTPVGFPPPPPIMPMLPPPLVAAPAQYNMTHLPNNNNNNKMSNTIMSTTGNNGVGAARPLNLLTPSPMMNVSQQHTPHLNAQFRAMSLGAATHNNNASNVVLRERVETTPGGLKPSPLTTLETLGKRRPSSVLDNYRSSTTLQNSTNVTITPSLEQSLSNTTTTSFYKHQSPLTLTTTTTSTTRYTNNNNFYSNHARNHINTNNNYSNSSLMNKRTPFGSSSSSYYNKITGSASKSNVTTSTSQNTTDNNRNNNHQYGGTTATKTTSLAGNGVEPKGKNSAFSR